MFYWIKCIVILNKNHKFMVDESSDNLQAIKLYTGRIVRKKKKIPFSFHFNAFGWMVMLVNRHQNVYCIWYIFSKQFNSYYILSVSTWHTHTQWFSFIFNSTFFQNWAYKKHYNFNGPKMTINLIIMLRELYICYSKLQSEEKQYEPKKLYVFCHVDCKV